MLTKEAEDALLALVAKDDPVITRSIACELGEAKLAARDLRARAYATPAGELLAEYILAVRSHVETVRAALDKPKETP
jgi:hypothetical protein